MDLRSVCAALEEIALLLEIRGENPFKTRAYESAARALEEAHVDIADAVASGSLLSIRGIGKGTALQIESLVKAGRSDLLDELRAAYPPSFRELLRVPGLGIKKLGILRERLGINSLADLEHAIHENRLRELPGFGEKTQAKLLAGVEFVRRTSGRFLLPAAWRAADERIAHHARPRRRLEVAGELRRQLEMVTEVTLVLEAEPGAAPIEDREQATNGVPCRVLSRSPVAFEACWLYESCSEEHRAALVRGAAERGLRFETSGIRREDGTVLPLQEAEIYAMLGLPAIHPLLREAPPHAGPYPAELVGPETVHGIFHVHTLDSDGSASVEAMVAEAEHLGYRWIGIADHSQTPVYANGLSPERLRAQGEAVRALRATHPGIRIFHGTESDILPDGSLDYDDALLDELDFVVASVHAQFSVDRDAMTRRIERALRHPATTHWGHPTGRLLVGRAAYDCDIDYLLRVCAEEEVAVEFNAHPQRLDLDWRWIGRAIELGVKVCSNPDAHAPEGLSDARTMIGTAAKGGLTPEGLLNALGPEEITTWLETRRRGKRERARRT